MKDHIPTVEEMCKPGGCIFYQKCAVLNPIFTCRIRTYTCPFSVSRMSKVGDVKVALQAWGYRARISPTGGDVRARMQQWGSRTRIHPKGRGSDFLLKVAVPPRHIKEVIKRLSPRLPLGTKFKVSSLPWWRNWIKRVVVI